MKEGPFKDSLVRLMRHARWADARTLASLQGLMPVPENAVRLFAHVVTTEQLYLARMQGVMPQKILQLAKSAFGSEAMSFCQGSS